MSIISSAKHFANAQLNKYFTGKKMRARADFCNGNLFKKMQSPHVMTDEEKKAFADYWKPYYDKTDLPFNYIGAEYYREKAGRFDVRFLPDDIYYTYIDPHFNDWTASHYMDNKCLYSRYYSGLSFPVRMPAIVASRMNDIWIDGDGELLPGDLVQKACAAHDEVIIKAATESFYGKGVHFRKGDDWEGINAAFREIGKNDVVIQTILRQHAELSRFNASSVNTIRIMTMLTQENARIVSAILRVGQNGSRKDNAGGGNLGITCGILPDGRLKKTARTIWGLEFEEHPDSGVRFGDFIVPGFDKARDMVLKLCKLLPRFRLVSWDIAIDEEGEPVLIEVNLCSGGLNIHQVNNGPLFGDETEAILAEVFGKK